MQPDTGIVLKNFLFALFLCCERRPFDFGTNRRLSGMFLCFAGRTCPSWFLCLAFQSAAFSAYFSWIFAGVFRRSTGNDKGHPWCFPFPWQSAAAGISCCFSAVFRRVFHFRADFRGSAECAHQPFCSVIRQNTTGVLFCAGVSMFLFHSRNTSTKSSSRIFHAYGNCFSDTLWAFVHSPAVQSIIGTTKVNYLLMRSSWMFSPSTFRVCAK